MSISQVKLSFWYHMTGLLFAFDACTFAECVSPWPLLLRWPVLFLWSMCLSLSMITLEFFPHEAKNPLFVGGPSQWLIWPEYPLERWHILIPQKRVWSSPFLDPPDLAHVSLRLNSSDLYLLQYTSSHEHNTFLSSLSYSGKLSNLKVWWEFLNLHGLSEMWVALGPSTVSGIWTVDSLFGTASQFWKSVLNPNGWYQNCIAVLWSVRHFNTH